MLHSWPSQVLQLIQLTTLNISTYTLTTSHPLIILPHHTTRLRLIQLGLPRLSLLNQPILTKQRRTAPLLLLLSAPPLTATITAPLHVLAGVLLLQITRLATSCVLLPPLLLGVPLIVFRGSICGSGVGHVTTLCHLGTLFASSFRPFLILLAFRLLFVLKLLDPGSFLGGAAPRV